MPTKEALRQLRAVAEANGWDVIKEFGTFKNAPVYQLGRLGLPPRAKFGLPHLYSVDQSGIVELSVDDVLQFQKHGSWPIPNHSCSCQWCSEHAPMAGKPNRPQLVDDFEFRL